MADGIVVTPSHNPPDNGGFKYNPPNGGPADTVVTDWIQNRANVLLEGGLKEVRRMPLSRALSAATTHPHDFINSYVRDLENIVDFDVIRDAGVRMGVDPLGGAGVHYWPAIAEHYRLKLSVISTEVDPAFGFMTVDWDGRIRMDPSSPWAMQRLINKKDDFDIAFACDTDHDRHGIVTHCGGLLVPNDYLPVLINYLFRHRPEWRPAAAVGKTVVSTSLIDRVAKSLDRNIFEVPVGFKWFVHGLFDDSLGFGGEESAGASFLRKNGKVWTTDKDGLVPALLAAEMTARTGHAPDKLYHELVRNLGEPVTDRVEARATLEQKHKLENIEPGHIQCKTLAGDNIESVIDHAPGNNAPIGGIKVITANGWFAARPSGTEDIYKIYAESFKDKVHLQIIVQEAQSIVDAVIA